jgi:hypothetical protein
VAENGRKVKAIALLFGRFPPLIQTSKKVSENGRKVKAIALLFGYIYIYIYIILMRPKMIKFYSVERVLNTI